MFAATEMEVYKVSVLTREQLLEWLSTDEQTLQALRDFDQDTVVARLKVGASLLNFRFLSDLSVEELFRKVTQWISNASESDQPELKAAAKAGKSKQRRDRERRAETLREAIAWHNALASHDGRVGEVIKSQDRPQGAASSSALNPHLMSALKVLQTYARRAPESLPPAIRFKSSEDTITIFDAFPKAKFHFLVLPRILATGLGGERLESLQSLLRGDRAEARVVVAALADEARAVREEVQAEMVRMYGFKWDVWTGFHAAPSMVHLHLHIVSADLCSEKLKHKKHYNSFHPKLGFFLHIDDVLSWFDAEPTYYASMVKQLTPKNYEPKLKEALTCFHCNSEMKNIPALKQHLDDEWEALRKKRTVHTKRKREVQEDKLKPDEPEKETKKAKPEEEGEAPKAE